MKEKIILAAILLIGFSLMVWGINYDLPYIFHPDEPLNFEVGRNMFERRSLNPYFFNYPSLPFYLNSAAIIPYYLVGKIAGVFTSISDIQAPIVLILGTTKAVQPDLIFLTRLVSVGFGLGAILFTFLIAKNLLGSSRIGYLAALMAACSSVLVTNSRTITPDISATFFLLGTVYFSSLIFREGKNWHYIVAGLFVGFAGSCKYNASLIGIVIPVAHFLRFGRLGFKDLNLYKAVVFSVLSFLLTTPHSIFSRDLFLFQLRLEAAHYSTGHAGMEGDTFFWYIKFLWENLGILAIFSVLQIGIGAYRRSKETILLFVFPLFYFAFVCMFVVRNSRTILPVFPFLFLLASAFLSFLYDKLANITRPTKSLKIAISFLLFIPIVPSLIGTVKTDVALYDPNSRVEARIWLESNLPKDSKVALESYSPFVDPQKNKVLGVGSMIVYPLDWYVKKGYDYLIFSKLEYGRYFVNPQMYPEQMQKYNRFFDTMKPIKVFFDNVGEVRIYKIKK